MSDRTSPAFTVTWWQILLGGWLVLTLLFWALNPGATEGYSPLARLVFWGVHVAVPLALCQLAQTWLAGWKSQSDWAPVLVAGALGGLAFVPVAAGLDTVFPDLDGADEPAGVGELWSELLSTWLPVMLCWAALNAPRLLRIRPSATKEPDEPEFFAKVPSDIGRDLVSLSAELHYLRVTTRGGNALVLYPFGRAVEELEGDAGQQIHRSHWASYGHVEAVSRKGDGAVATMSNGDRLPVSRRYKKRFSDALAERNEPVIRAK